MDATRTLEVRGPNGSEVQPSSTVAPFYTALNGVNQPMNLLFRDVLWWTLGIAGFAVLLIRILEILWAKLRQVSAMSVPREKQSYWKFSQWGWMPGMKKHIIYAPLWRKRHNREIKLSSAVNVGTLPSRLHSIIIGGYLFSNVAYMFVLDWQQPNKWALCAELRGRSGTLSVVNMVPLIIFAGRNNPLIPLLKISFDTYNLLHRWVGRIVVIEAVIHTIAWAIPAVADKGWDGIFKKIFNSSFLGSGFIGTTALVLLMIGGASPLRHAFYETFLNLHIFLALVIFVCTWVHCATGHGVLPQLSWIMAIMAIWFADRFARFIRLAYANWSKSGFSHAYCEAMPGEVTRVTLNLPRYVKIRPGTHAYLRFSGLTSWESHPFSIASVDYSNNEALPLSEKEPLNGSIDKSRATTAVTFIIGAQTGLTRKLFREASQSPRGVRLRAAMEGPYAGHHNLDSYGHLVLFAGSTGITHQISYLRHHMEGYNAGTVATRRLTLVWIIRSYESLEWVRPIMDSILRIPNRKDILRIQIFVTRPLNPLDLTQTSSTVKMFPGRPNVPLLLMKEVQDQVGAMAVSVCGPGGLADDVRGAVRAVQGDTVVDFIEESFTW
ncbi:ferric reductase [Moelleriella libera RCEF 2490]|uniref:ferric-chelate reductase (NADPH) n=1 Tax=Moelleriella libera RCEF 2490 TaxID=1081109 RepID=A0A168DFF9_9HYPO|nr:ferric reductase [Moelleriella libera RCEF 2490]